jgi:uncharacterized membrane protein SpoIIM required for sporulation/uncharacterized RDD family membrane protein YckC
MRSAAHTRTTRTLDQVVDVETPEQIVFSYTVAGIGSRAAAALIDHVILITAVLILFLLYRWLIEPAGGVAASSGAGLMRQSTGWVIAILLLIQFIAQWGYYVLFEALWDGQTPGKRWLRLRVVQDGGYSVSFSASAARNIARIIDMQPAPTYVTGIIAIAVSKTGKRAGDQLAGTLVVRERVMSPSATSRGAEPERLARPSSAVLSEQELELLQRFLSRAGGIDAGRREALASQIAERFRSYLPDVADPMHALSALLEREMAARAQGAGGRGETGAAREQYALLVEGEPRWASFAAKLAAAQRTGLHRMSADEVASFVSDYREIAADLARLTTAARGREIDALFSLSRLVAGGHNLLYRQKKVARRETARFLFRSVPAELRRSALPILAAAVLLFGSGAAACIAVIRNPAVGEELVPPGMIDRAEQDAAQLRAGDARYIDVEDYERPIISSQVLSNNIQVAFVAFASGLTAGIFTVLILLINGLSLGAALGVFANHGVGRLIADFVIAHSAFELSAICIAAGAGFLVAGAILLPGARTRREALVVEGRRALRLLAAAALFLIFAGAIEGLISPRTDLGFELKAGVALVSALLIAGYVLLGRGAGETSTIERTAYSGATA